MLFCNLLHDKAWWTETFRIILINSIPLHILRPSTRLGCPTVRIGSYWNFIHHRLIRNSSLFHCTFHAWVGWVGEIKYGLIAAARGALISWRLISLKKNCKPPWDTMWYVRYINTHSFIHSFSNQAFHPPQNDLQQFSAESKPSAGSTSKARAKKNTRERWDPDDKKVLVQLWGDNLGKLESKDSHKAWEEVTRYLLNERQKTKKSVDQCQRKMEHFSHEAVAWSNHLVEYDHGNELQTTSSQDEVNAKAFSESFERSLSSVECFE